MLGTFGAAAPSGQTIARAVVACVPELGVMAVIAAMTQPGRADRSFERTVDVPLPSPVRVASTARLVLLMQGFAGADSCWFVLTRALRTQGVAVGAFHNLSFGTSVESLADRPAAKVASLLC